LATLARQSCCRSPKLQRATRPSSALTLAACRALCD
jgi:hypothetical protein